MTSALIVVDVQKDFVEGGSLAVEGGLELARKIAKNLPKWKNSYDYVVATKDWHINPGDHWSDEPNYFTSWPIHCEAGTPGAEFAGSLLKDEDFDAIFSKGQYSASYTGFDGTTLDIYTEGGVIDLDGWLKDRNVDELDIIGIATDFCVAATAASAYELGYETTILTHLTAAVNDENAAKVLDILEASGVTVVGRK